MTLALFVETIAVPPHLYYYSEGDLAEELQESLIDIYGQVPEDVLTPNGLVFKTQAKGLALEMNTAVAVDHFVFQVRAKTSCLLR